MVWNLCFLLHWMAQRKMLWSLFQSWRWSFRHWLFNLLKVFLKQYCNRQRVFFHTHKHSTHVGSMIQLIRNQSWKPDVQKRICITVSLYLYKTLDKLCTCNGYIHFYYYLSCLLFYLQVWISMWEVKN